MRTRQAVGSALPVILIALLVMPAVGAFEQAPQAPLAVFQLEVPELGITPTDKPELTIPSPNLKLLLIHVLRPQADNINYDQIYTFLNGEATAIVSDITASERGKLVKKKKKKQEAALHILYSPRPDESTE